MKKLIAVAAITVSICAQSFAQRAKYVFYFIGDGMGVNAVHLTETYLASLDGKLGVEPMIFSQFPVVSFGTTYSANDNVTDSSASGTALSTGVKTVNNHLGLDENDNMLTTIAEKAKRSGRKVGIATSVGINHATPAAFYAHQPDRNLFYKISLDMIKADFDFYSGAYFEKKNKLEDGTKVRNITEVMEEAGYSIAYGIDEFDLKCKDADKMVLLPAPKKGISYGIDRIGLGRDELTLEDITRSAIDFLQKDNKKGFFLMVEGGDIDGAEHGHDAAAAIQEIIDFNDAVKVAYKFYQEHPQETLIIVTADHETGGVTFDPDKSDQLALLANQKLSQERTSSILKKLIESKAPEILSWEETKAFLTEYFGLWDKVPVSWEQEKYLHDTYEYTVARKDPGHQVDLYADNAILIARAVLVLNTNAHVYWGTAAHSAGPVPTYAIGAGQEKFAGKMDNTLIPLIIEQIARYR